MIRTVLREYIPASWFHPIGIKKVLRRLEPRLPDVSGKLFLTFTLARETCNGEPEAAFEYARKRLRRLFYKLRRGVEWQGRTYRINAPYCVKVEFHQDGWAHFHVIFLTSRFLPGPLLNELWALGRCNVQRIENRDFRYLLKYVCKGGALPDWIKNRGRLRVFQSSHGFLKDVPKKEKAQANEGQPSAFQPIRRKGDIGNLGQRMARWNKTGLLVTGRDDESARSMHYKCIHLSGNFRDILGRKALSLARKNRYLGEAQVLITSRKDRLEWTTS